MASTVRIEINSDDREYIDNTDYKSNVIVENYAEGQHNNVAFRFECMCKALLAEGFLLGTIQKFVNFDGSEVFEMDDK